HAQKFKMIQILPNELQIEILTYVVTETNFQKFCTLRTVCKKWNIFIPLVMHKAVISRLNADLKLELTYWNDIKWNKKLSPTYDDYTKAFTFILDDIDDDTSDSYDDISKILSDHNISFMASIEKCEDVPNPVKLGTELGDLTWLEFLNDDI
ncbi:981_t:CDS:2, partial [Cetraspora pellucida]